MTRKKMYAAFCMLSITYAAHAGITREEQGACELLWNLIKTGQLDTVESLNHDDPIVESGLQAVACLGKSKAFTKIMSRAKWGVGALQNRASRSIVVAQLKDRSSVPAHLQALEPFLQKSLATRADAGCEQLNKSETLCQLRDLLKGIPDNATRKEAYAHYTPAAARITAKLFGFAEDASPDTVTERIMNQEPSNLPDEYFEKIPRDFIGKIVLTHTFKRK